MNKPMLINTLVSAVGGGLIGGAITYVSVKKHFAARAQADIDDVKQAYKDRFDGKRVVNLYGDMPGEARPNDVTATPVPGANLTDAQRKAAEDLVARLGYQTASEAAGTVSEEDKTVNIYDRVEQPEEPEDDPKAHILLRDYDLEGRRTQHIPYLISEREFRNTNTEWDKSDIMYYEGDDTLTDEDEKIVHDVDYMVGEVHLDFFGVRSSDKNVVYVRAPQISTDYKIHRNSGSYQEIVLNMPPERESIGSRRARFGDDD
jgi:hypothetical protein